MMEGFTHSCRSAIRASRRNKRSSSRETIPASNEKPRPARRPDGAKVGGERRMKRQADRTTKLARNNPRICRLF